MFADKGRESCDPCNGVLNTDLVCSMLKSYFVEYILLTFLKHVFFKKMDICSQM